LHPSAALNHLGDWCAKQARTRQLLILSFFTVGYLLLTCALASQKLLWYDELFTYHLARLPGVAEIWSELAHGTDLLPPLNHVLTQASIGALGDNSVALRLPAIIGFWVMCLCVFRFALRWCAPLFALLALLLPLTTTAFRVYAIEARPYGLVLGFTGLALVCWQEAARGRGRPWSLFGLAASLATAVSAHYYAVLLLIPLGLGELARLWRRRRADVPLWLALLTGLVPLVFFLPLIRGAREYSVGFQGGNAYWEATWMFYHSVLEANQLPLLVLLTAAVFLPVVQASRLRGHAGETPDPRQATGPAQPQHELVAVAALVLLPVFAVLLGRTITNAYYHRYAISAVIGISLVLTLAAFRASRGSPVFASLALFVLLGWVGVQASQTWKKLEGQQSGQLSACEHLLKHNPDGLPVAVTSPIHFMMLTHYAPPELAERLVYVASPELSMKYHGTKDTELALSKVQPLTGLKVVDYQTFTSENRQFLLYEAEYWLLQALLADGADVRMATSKLYQVTR
jgi:4-amino-4-deoxy-L-arabinose transferase-like glycosyltransferase